MVRVARFADVDELDEPEDRFFCCEEAAAPEDFLFAEPEAAGEPEERCGDASPVRSTKFCNPAPQSPQNLNPLSHFRPHRGHGPPPSNRLTNRRRGTFLPESRSNSRTWLRIILNETSTFFFGRGTRACGCGTRRRRRPFRSARTPYGIATAKTFQTHLK